MAIILPHGVLFRGGAEERIRTHCPGISGPPVRLLRNAHSNPIVGRGPQVGTLRIADWESELA
ncbi:hypothetical protein [Mesorhizobium sp. M0195]|uniref:hypothetical protein n=1 Tax=Mesorhizobium sp. M0195 TaxID=2956910 RepID=UPI00333D14C9